MKIAIVGSRNCDCLPLKKIMAHIPPQCRYILSGGARGVDALAVEAARKLGLPVRIFWPDYKKYGRSAPLRRNQQMVAAADRVLAFWDHRSPGTAHTIAQCIGCGVPVQVIGIGQGCPSQNSTERFDPL